MQTKLTEQEMTLQFQFMSLSRSLLVPNSSFGAQLHEIKNSTQQHMHEMMSSRVR